RAGRLRAAATGPQLGTGKVDAFVRASTKDAGPHTLSTAAKLQPLGPPVSRASADYGYAGATTKPARGKCTQTSPISRSLRRITMSWTSEATYSPRSGSRTVSSGVTVTVWPGFRPLGSWESTVAVAIDVASLATSSACCALIWLRLPWPIAAMRSAQVWSLGKPSSGGAAGPKFCRKYQAG